MSWDFSGFSDDSSAPQSIQGGYSPQSHFSNGSPYPNLSPVDDLDKETRSAFNLFLRNRPVAPPPPLQSLVPDGWGIPPEFQTYYWTVQTPWDADIPPVFEPLLDTTVKSATPEQMVKPQYDRFFQKVGGIPVSTPRSSQGIISPIKLSIPYKYEYPEGWGYCSRVPEGFVYIVPKTFLVPRTPYSLVMSRGRIKCIEFYKIALTINDTLYLSVVNQHPLEAEKGTNRKVIWCSTSNDFAQTAIPALQEIWHYAGVIPSPRDSLLSTGECLSFKHDYGDLYE